MRKLARSTTVAFTPLKSTADSPSLPLLPFGLFVLFLLLLIVTTMINPYNSSKNLSPIQIICENQPLVHLSTTFQLHVINNSVTTLQVNTLYLSTCIHYTHINIEERLTNSKVCTSLILISNKGKTFRFSCGFISNEININNFPIPGKTSLEYITGKFKIWHSNSVRRIKKGCSHNFHISINYPKGFDNSSGKTIIKNA